MKQHNCNEIAVVFKGIWSVRAYGVLGHMDVTEANPLLKNPSINQGAEPLQRATVSL